MKTNKIIDVKIIKKEEDLMPVLRDGIINKEEELLKQIEKEIPRGLYIWEKIAVKKGIELGIEAGQSSEREDEIKFLEDLLKLWDIPDNHHSIVQRIAELNKKKD